MRAKHCVALLTFAALAAPLHAQQSTDPAGAGDATGIALPFAHDGPPPPQPPATITRAEDGRVTVRAVRLDAPLRLDGRLDEPLYTAVPPLTDFIQNEPNHGAAATEKTEVWIAFDRDQVYISMRAWESQPERMIANEMRRDSQSVLQNENFAFALDTFYDRRNAFMFQFNPLGGRMDGQNSNEGQYNGDWNPVWRLAVGRFEGGWVGEAAVPFKSLRYRPGRAQIWGFNARRINRWKNEVSFLTPMIRGRGPGGIMLVSQHATLVGIEAPAGSRTFEVKPYAIADLVTDREAVPRVANELDGDVGFDLKYGVTQNLTADFTYNTDFAQVEADEQQVNLTRFDLFFPEKREFFLENQGVFNFGGIATNNAGLAPILFYSRRIGLDRGREVPIEAGGRLTGRLGRFNLGLVNIQTGDEPVTGARAANFTVARLRRDVLRRSAVGAIFTRRGPAASGGGANETFGVDGTFTFYDNLHLRGYWAGTRTPGLEGDDRSYRAHLDYNADRYGVELQRLRVGDNFQPDVGFVRRDDMRRTFGRLRFSPRPTRIRSVRKFSWEAVVDYIENGAGVLETRERQGEFAVEFQNSDWMAISYTDGNERLSRPFPIAPAVTIPVGSYGVDTFRASFTLGQQRRASGTAFVERGAFYGGTRTAFGYSGARLKASTQLAVEPAVSVNRVELPFGDFTTRLVSARITYTITPMLFVSGLTQYSSGVNGVSANVRLRWEYRPGSELFVVFNESRDTLRRGFPGLQNRSVVVKVNRLFRL